ncbi:MAG: DNA methylase [Candidatus Azobacteroides sp.]|nr:DNA methylase [Candidatus Azobacteroides sp.]
MNYNQSETIIIKRSQINFAPYNPKKHSKEAINEQAKNIKRVGILGGIVWNKMTGNLVSGHKRTMALDKINKYDGTPETDYDMKVEKVEMDGKTEKEQNVYMDAAYTNTMQDVDLLAELIPQIDYKNAGLTEEDLSIIGVDYLFQTDEETAIASELDNLMSGTNGQKTAEKEAKKAAVKAMKEEIKQKANEKVQDMVAYIMISFDSSQAKEAFMRRFGYDKREKYIKGEAFSEMIERIG